MKEVREQPLTSPQKFVSQKIYINIPTLLNIREFRKVEKTEDKFKKDWWFTDRSSW